MGVDFLCRKRVHLFKLIIMRWKVHGWVGLAGGYAAYQLTHGIQIRRFENVVRID